MGQTIIERVATLEAEMRQAKAELTAANEKLDKIVRTLDQMSGGKKAVLGLFTLIGMAIGAATSILTAIASGVHFTPK